MSVLMTNVCHYTRPGTVPVLLRNHDALYCHDGSFADPAAGRRFEIATRPRAAFTLPTRPSALHVESLDRDLASFGSKIAQAVDWTGAGVSHLRSRS
jgi:hypothetical protein